MDVSELCIDPSKTSDEIEPRPRSIHSDSRISISSINNSSSINILHSSSSASINNPYEYNNEQYSTTILTPDSNHNNGNQNDRNHIPQRQNLLKKVIDRCKLLQNGLSQYRDQPLTESLRSSLLDHVYCATVAMLESLATLENNTLLEEEEEEEEVEEEDNMNQDSATTHHPSISTTECKQEYSMIRQARNITESTRPKYRRRSKRSMAGQRCHSCNTTETPEWRRGPDGARTLCNACGLHYSKLLRKKSLTVQTHNYLLDQQSEERRVPRIIQFPIVHMPAPSTNRNGGSFNIIRLQTSTSSTSSTQPMIYELSENEVESIQRGTSWRPSQ